MADKQPEFAQMIVESVASKVGVTEGLAGAQAVFLRPSLIANEPAEPYQRTVERVIQDYRAARVTTGLA